MISIIMPTHNKVRDVTTCLTEVFDQIAPRKNVEVVVVNDGSRDETPQVLDALAAKHPEMRVINLAGGGPARARNAGIASARGDLVVMLDDDVVPLSGWLDALLFPFRDAEVIGVEGRVIPVGGEEWGPLGMAPRNSGGGVYLTCNIAFRRGVLLEFGGFDEGFPYPAFEDTDLAMQALQRGSIAWAPNAIVEHPRRCWSLARAVREIRFNEALVRFAARYRCMGWIEKPTNWPRLRVAWSAIIALPVGRILRGLRDLPRTPVPAIRFCVIAALQGMLALALIWPPIVRGGRSTPRLSSLPARDA